MNYTSSPFNAIIADDHPLFRKGMASALRNMPFIKHIDEASDGAEALQLLKKGNYALVMLDINMKGMDGRTAAVQINKQFPLVKIIAISMLDDAFTIRQMYQAGCHGYLVKNSDESEIIKAIEVVMADKKYFTDDILEKIVREPDDNNYKTLPSGHSLSATDIKLIQLICSGKSNKQIADELSYTTRTVEKYRERLYEKIGASNATDIFRFALRNNIINPE